MTTKSNDKAHWLHQTMRQHVTYLLPVFFKKTLPLLFSEVNHQVTVVGGVGGYFVTLIKCIMIVRAAGLVVTY